MLNVPSKLQPSEFSFFYCPDKNEHEQQRRKDAREFGSLKIIDSIKVFLAKNKQKANVRIGSFENNNFAGRGPVFNLPKGERMKVTVNSGNVGTPVALELARLGHQVVLTVRTPKSNPDWDKLGIRQVPFDINDPASMAGALKEGEAFFSLTPLVENMVEAGTRMIQAAREAGVRKIVRMSAQSAGPTAAIQLGRWHHAVEKAVTDSGIPFTILRPANFMQNYLAYGTPETIKAQSAFYSPLGDAKISVIDTRDISAVAARVLVESGHEGKCYDLTGGESLSNQEIAGILSRALGRKITHVSIPAAKATEAMAGSGMPGWLVSMLTELNAFGAMGNLAPVKPDTGLILKRRPILFSKFVEDHLATFKS